MNLLSKEATCNHSSCTNRGVPITVLTFEDSRIWCGGCGSEVTYVVTLEDQPELVMPDFPVDPQNFSQD